MTTTKIASDLQIGDVMHNGKHRLLITGIISTTEKAVTFNIKVVSEASRGFGNCGWERKNIGTKVKVN